MILQCKLWEKIQNANAGSTIFLGGGLWASHLAPCRFHYPSCKMSTAVMPTTQMRTECQWCIQRAKMRAWLPGWALWHRLVMFLCCMLCFNPCLMNPCFTFQGSANTPSWNLLHASKKSYSSSVLLKLLLTCLCLSLSLPTFVIPSNSTLTAHRNPIIVGRHTFTSTFRILWILCLDPLRGPVSFPTHYCF